MICITFVIHIPLSIDLLLDLRLDKQRFAVTGDIALRATARAAEPLLLIVDVAKPRPSDITVNVSSSSIRGEVVRILGGVDGEIRRFIAQYVADEIDAPHVASCAGHRCRRIVGLLLGWCLSLLVYPSSHPGMRCRCNVSGGADKTWHE